MGCTGWGYKDVLPYFIKSEDNANEKLVMSGNKLLLLLCVFGYIHELKRECLTC